MTAKYRKKNKSATGEIFKNLEQTTSQAEQFAEKNQKLIGIVFVAFLLAIAGYYGYRTLILAPKQKQANKDMFSAVQYLKQDSLDLALNGDGQNYGFIEIINEFSGTKAANLAKYYAGTALLKKGEYEKALEYLESFSTKEEIISSQAKGNIGDIFMQLERYQEAKEYYIEAAENHKNAFSTPIFLRKAAMASIASGNWTDVGMFYKKIKEGYPDSSEAEQADQFIARSKAINSP